MTTRTVPFAEIPREAWNAFCDAHPAAWWFHRAEWLDYCVARGGQNISYAAVSDDNLILIQPAIYEPETYSLTMGGEPTPIAAGEEDDGDALDIGGLPLMRAAYMGNVHHRLTRRTPNLSNLAELLAGQPSSAVLRDISFSTRLLDLTLSREDLWSDVRKSYRPLITKRADSCHFYREPRLMAGVCCDLHGRAAGRVTRPLRTWEMMAEWAEAEHGFALTAFEAGEPVAYAFFICYKNIAYYSSGASIIPDVQHAVIWQAILDLKERGIRTLELGWERRNPTEKEKNIEFFKAGFGGRLVAVPAVELIIQEGGSSP